MSSKKTTKKKNNKIEEVKLFFDEGETKKTKKIKFLILPVVVIGILVLSLSIVKNIESPIVVLNKVKMNMQSMEYRSATIDTKITKEGKKETKDSLIMECDIDDDYKISLDYNNEYKTYLKVSGSDINLYLTNNILDLIGITESHKDKWLIYETTSKKLKKEIDKKSNNAIEDYKTKYSDIDIIRFLDEDHYYYVDKENTVNHYQLVIDKPMVKSIIHEINNNLDNDSKLSNKTIAKILDYYDKYIQKDIIIDIYIDVKEYIIKRVYIEFSNDYLKKNNIDNIILDSNIKYNDTIVKISEDALNSDYTIEKYIDKYKKNK